MKPCATANCPEAVDYADQRFCSTCAGVLLRTGRPPELLPAPRQPVWLTRAQQQPHGLARDLTSRSAA